MNKDSIYKYLRGEASLEEIEQIHSWINQSEVNRKFLAEQKVLWTISEMPDKKADDEDLNIIKKKISSKRIFDYKVLFYSAAALFLLMFALNIVLFLFSSQEKEKRIMLTEVNREEISRIYTEKGTKAEIYLPDGSKVWLNSDTEISYATNFPGNTRELTLNGEAYFEVAKDSLKPMMITTSKGFIVKVLGTSFHIKCYSNDDNAKTTLFSGNIKLICPLENNGEISKEINVGLNETVIFGKVKTPEIITHEKVSASNDIAWRKGILVFDRTPLSEVVKMLERWHGAEFIINDPASLNQRLTATFKTESLVQILYVIKLLTGIEYTIEENNKVTIM